MNVGVIDQAFAPDGSLSDATRAALASLGSADHGRAIAESVRQLAGFPILRRTVAIASVDEAMGAFRAAGTRPEPAVTALLDVYTRVAADISLRDVTDLIARLLRDVDRTSLLASLDAVGHGDLRARLIADIGALEAEAMTRSAKVGIDDGGAGAAPGEPNVTYAKPPDPAPPVSDAPPAATPTYRAYGVLACDERVLVGQPFEVEVGLGDVRSAGVSGPALDLPDPDERGYDLDVQLFADGFDLASGEAWRHRLHVSADDRYPTITVHLTARELPDRIADRKISATFAIDGETHGLAERYVRVTTDRTDLPTDSRAGRTATGANITAPSGEPKADLTITIRKGLRDGTLLWAVESSRPGIGLPDDRPVPSDIGDNPEAFAKNIIQTLYIHGDGPGLEELLVGIGKGIRDEMPVEIRQVITEAAAAANPDRLQILLLTEEPFVPWELAWIDVPWERGAANYLGAQANVGRWVLDPAIPTDPRRRIDATSMAVVWGRYEDRNRLRAAELEAQDLRTSFGAASIDAQPEPVAKILNGRPPADIIHFAVHGKYDPDGAADGIYLVSGAPVVPWQIVGSKLARRAPFVFLNACQVGSAGAMLGNYSGIAAAFLEAGASAVVAPLWSIDDRVARRIATAFYAEALRPIADGTEAPLVGELMRRERAKTGIRGRRSSATYLAYQFYGHPSLRLSWSPPTVAGPAVDG